MATGSSSNQKVKHKQCAIFSMQTVECDICSEVMSQPYVPLQCLHQFCTECSNRFNRVNDTQDVSRVEIVCPLCGRSTPEEFIQDRSVRNNLLDIYDDYGKDVHKKLDDDLGEVMNICPSGKASGGLLSDDNMESTVCHNAGSNIEFKVMPPISWIDKNSKDSKILNTELPQNNNEKVLNIRHNEKHRNISNINQDKHDDLYHCRSQDGLSLESSEESRSSNSSLCMQCDQPEVNALCQNCDIELCRNCADRHLRIPICRNHVIIDLCEAFDSGRDESIKQQVLNMHCKEHIQCEVKYNCIPCQTAICSECYIENHKQHEIESLEDAIKNIKAQAIIHMIYIRAHKDIDQKYLTQLGNMKEQCIKQCETNKSQVLKQKEAMIEKIEADCNELSHKISEQQAAKLKEINLMMTDVESRVSNQDSILSWGHNFINTGTTHQSVSTLQSEVLSKMETVVKQQSINHGSRNVKPLEIEFCSKGIDTKNNCLGKMIIFKGSI